MNSKILANEPARNLKWQARSNDLQQLDIPRQSDNRAANVASWQILEHPVYRGGSWIACIFNCCNFIEKIRFAFRRMKWKTPPWQLYVNSIFSKCSKRDKQRDCKKSNGNVKKNFSHDWICLESLLSWSAVRLSLAVKFYIDKMSRFLELPFQLWWN